MAKAAKPKAAAKAKAAAKLKMAAKSDARVFSVDTRFQKMARREGGIPRDKAIAQAQTEIKEVKSHFDDWLGGELKEFVRLIKKVEGAKAGKDWVKPQTSTAINCATAPPRWASNCSPLSPARSVRS